MKDLNEQFIKDEKLNSSKKELIIIMSEDMQKVKSIKKQIENVFSGNKRNIKYNSESLAKKFETFMETVENFTDKTKIDIYWSVAETILEELEAYGIYDVPIEETVLNAIEKIILLLKKNKEELNSERKQMISELLKHSFCESSISDNLYYYAEEICLEKDDYLIMIENVKTKRKSGSSYYKELLANLYEKIDDEVSQLKTLESDLKYGMGYWKLAKYWIKKNDTDKVLSVVLEGIKFGEGRKNELYDYMENYYLNQKNYNMLLELLQEKTSKERFSDSKEFTNDSTYKILYEYYTTPEIYNDLKKLYYLRLQAIVPDFKLYKDAKEFLIPEDFNDFEEKMIKKLNDNNKGYFSMSITSLDETLIKIFLEKKDFENLYKIVHKDIQFLKKYESKLVSLYPDKYLKEYTKKVSNLISFGDRESYKNAIPFIKGIKKIYSSVLKNNETWREYIYNLKESNRRLKALHDELKKAGL